MAIDTIGENELAAQRAKEAAIRQAPPRPVARVAGIDQLTAQNPRGPTRSILSGAPQNPAINPVDREFAQARAEQNARFAEKARMESPRPASIAQVPTQPLTRMQKASNFLGTNLPLKDQIKQGGIGFLASSAIDSANAARGRATEDYDKRFGAATQGIDSLANWSQNKLQQVNNWSGLSKVAPSLSAKIENLPNFSSETIKRSLGVLSDVGADMGDTLLPGTPLRDRFADTQKPASIASLPTAAGSFVVDGGQRTQPMNASPASQNPSYGGMNNKPITEGKVNNATQRSIADIETTGGRDSLAAYQQQMANQPRQNNLPVDTGGGSSVQQAMDNRSGHVTNEIQLLNTLLGKGRYRAAAKLGESIFGSSNSGNSTESRRQGEIPSIDDIASANRMDAESDMLRLNSKRQARMQSLMDQYINDPQSEEGQGALKSIYALEGKQPEDKIMDVDVPLLDAKGQLETTAKGVYSPTRGLLFDPRQMLAPQQAVEGGQKTSSRIANMPDGTRRKYFTDGTFEVLQ